MRKLTMIVFIFLSYLSMKSPGTLTLATSPQEDPLTAVPCPLTKTATVSAPLSKEKQKWFHSRGRVSEGTPSIRPLISEAVSSKRNQELTRTGSVH